MKKYCFLTAFMGSACAIALAAPTVDLGAVSTSAQSAVTVLNSLGLWAPVVVVLNGVIAVIQVLKYFFPHIDGK